MGNQQSSSTPIKLNCNPSSNQCCWATTALITMNRAPENFNSYEVDSDGFCCDYGGITCARKGDSIVITKISWTKMKLSGTVAGDELSYLKDLVELDLSDNQLTEIPASLGNLSSLESLNLSWNRKLKGTIPKSISDLTINKLKFIDVGLNSIRASWSAGSKDLNGDFIVYPNIATNQYPNV